LAAILLVRSVLTIVLVCGLGFASSCNLITSNRIPGLWMFGSDLVYLGF
jgi:hypothetical protein